MDKVDAAVTELRRATEADEADPIEPIIAGVSLDVMNDASVEQAMKKCMDQFGRLDILVNCAGVMVKKPTFDLSMADFNMVYDSHVTGSFRCAQAACHLMREQHAGCIINIADLAAFETWPDYLPHGASKAALVYLTRALAWLEGAPARQTEAARAELERALANLRGDRPPDDDITFLVVDRL